MPLYEYRCTSCDHDFDCFSTSSRRGELRTCPECGKETGTHVEIPLKGSRIDTKGSYQMKAILRSGQQIEGHFGVARKRKGVYRP